MQRKYAVAFSQTYTAVTTAHVTASEPRLRELRVSTVRGASGAGASGAGAGAGANIEAMVFAHLPIELAALTTATRRRVATFH